MSYPAELGRIKRNKRGNYEIKQPAFISELLEKGQDDFWEWKDKFEHFKEEISIFLIVTDEKLAKEVLDAFTYNDEVEKEYEIHKIASYSIEEQTIVDNLDFYELNLYKYFKIEVTNIRRIIYHYVLDYAESGEDVESGAKREILETPHVWETIDDYWIFRTKLTPSPLVLKHNKMD